MSALKALIAAMPDIAHALNGFTDPDLKLRAFDALINAAQQDAGNPTYTAPTNTDTTFIPRINDGPSYNPR